jgi:hypothetical protein
MLCRLSHFRNCAVIATDGDVGTVKDLYFDNRAWTARYVILETGAWLVGRRVVLAPTAITSFDRVAQRVAVALSRQQIEQSPSLDDGDGISREREEEWHRHSGLAGYWGAPQVDVSTTPLPSAPEPAPTSMGSSPGSSQVWSSSEITDYALEASDGDVGRVQDFLVDETTWKLGYFVVLRSWLAGTETLVSPSHIGSLSMEEMKVHVRLPRELVLNAPVWDGAEPPATSYEAALRAHYGTVVS